MIRLGQQQQALQGENYASTTERAMTLEVEYSGTEQYRHKIISLVSRSSGTMTVVALSVRSHTCVEVKLGMND